MLPITKINFTNLALDCSIAKVNSEPFNRENKFRANYIDLSNKSNLIKPGEMSIGFGVDCEVKKLKQKDVVITNMKVFKKAVQKFFVVVAKISFERTPLASSHFQSASVFDPQNLLQICKEKATDLFKRLLTNIIELNIFLRTVSLSSKKKKKKSTGLMSSSLKSLESSNTKSFHTL